MEYLKFFVEVHPAWGFWLSVATFVLLIASVTSFERVVVAMCKRKG